MREILFRGKCNEIGKYNGQWIEGFYAVDDGKPLIAHSTNNGLNGYFCEPGSIGEYTGMQDKNNRKIFEGDIVKFPHGTKSMNGKIEYIEEDCIYYLTYKTGRVPFGVFFNGFELEIIGNIHDNPELLEVKG